MANKVQRVLEYFGVHQRDTDDELDEFEAEEELDVPPMNADRRPKERRNAQNTNVVSLPTVARTKMVVYSPVSVEDARNIIDNVKSRKSIVVNLESIDIETARRILDSLSGACYALGGTVYKVSQKIFIVAPASCDIIGNSDGVME